MQINFCEALCPLLCVNEHIRGFFYNETKDVPHLYRWRLPNFIKGGESNQLKLPLAYEA